MKTLKSLITTLILGGSLVIGGCGNRENQKDPSHYTYNGKIGQDSVIFTRLNMYDDYSNLRVIKPDGRVIEYIDDYKDDLIIYKVDITKNCGEGYTAFPWGISIKKGNFIDSVCDNAYFGEQVLKKAQEQFDNYLHKIDSIKKTPGYKDKNKAENYQGTISRDTILDSILNQALKDLD